MNTCIYYSSYLPSHRLRFYALFITLILIQLITHLNAQTTWTGSVDNTWSNPDNWSNGVPGTTPGSGSVVVIGGNIAKAWDCFIPAARQYLQSQGATMNLQPALLGEDAAIMGAACLWT